MAALATLTLAACSTAPTVAPAPAIAKPPVVAPAEMPVEVNAPDPAQMLGSWAGAMGQTQFLPTNYLAYAVDADGDGRHRPGADPLSAPIASGLHRAAARHGGG